MTRKPAQLCLVMLGVGSDIICISFWGWARSGRNCSESKILRLSVSDVSGPSGRGIGLIPEDNVVLLSICTGHGISLTHAPSIIALCKCDTMNLIHRLVTGIFQWSK